MSTISNNLIHTASACCSILKKTTFRGLFISSLLSVVMMISSADVRATHLAGGQITYVEAGNNGLDYDVTFTFYRDCAGLAGAIPTATAIINASSANAGANFNTVAPGVNLGEIVPLCLTATSTCTGGPTEGRARWDYTVTITLPSKETDWVFSSEYNARNGAITTGPSGPMYVFSTLNNTIFPYNNAPSFANDPAAFIYINEAFCFNNGAVDIDGDSLAYSLITPLRNATTPVTYIGPYSATQPLISSPPVTIDPATGDVCMLPTAIDVTVMAILVEEYRGGVLIGSVERDIQVSVLVGPDALPSMDGINGTNTYFDTIPEGCIYTFITNSFDTDAGQCVTMTTTAATVPFFNSFSTAGGCPSLVRPTGTFDFSPGVGDVRSQPYCFTVTVRDDFCAINGQQVRAFCLYVIDFTADFTASAPACVGEGVNFYSVQPFKPSYRYNWDFGAGSVSSLAQDTAANPIGVTYTTPGAKTVQLTIIGPGGCSVDTSKVITINSLPLATYTSSATSMSKCAGDTVSFTNLGTVGPGVSHAWDFGLLGFPASSNIENPAPVIYLTDAPITTTHTVTNQFGCIASDTVNFTINQTPTADFSTNAPGCTGINYAVDFINTGT
ncbi:MAG: PKD domain-containing protein, partial [Flavobacteriales bacterium]|nr:PKD domain-containing protein [Flavobacteriales bacterium]